MPITPSEFQIEIVNSVKSGDENLLIDAVAGSAKTTTIIMSAESVPEESKLILAFNVSMKDEIEKKSEHIPNISVQTVYGYGFTALQLFYKSRVDKDKYDKLYDMRVPYWDMPVGIDPFYIKKDVLKIVDLMRLNLVSYEGVELGTEKHIEKVGELSGFLSEHDVTITSYEDFWAWELIRLGKENMGTVDFIDMIYMPVALDVPSKKFSITFVDESQDLSLCQIALVRRSYKKKIVFVGDVRQAIYAFNGASAESFETIRMIDNLKELDLPISYRCPKSVVRLVRSINPKITANPDCKEGKIEFDVLPYQIHSECMIICRNTAPLVDFYYELHEIGKKCQIIGTDIVAGLMKTINSTKAKSLQELYIRFEDQVSDMILGVMEMKRVEYDVAKTDQKVQNLLDKQRAIRRIGKTCSDFKELSFKIKEVFTHNDSKIVLSTVHRAKGKEHDHVYILRDSLMPSFWAKTDKQKVQEDNIKYVAYTRSKNYLGFIKEEERKFEKKDKSHDFYI